MKNIIFGAITLIGLAILINSFVITNEIITKKETIINENIPDSFNNLKIVQLSDILINDYTSIEKLKEIVLKTNELKPDIIVFTGDLIDDIYDISEVQKDEIINELTGLKATISKINIYGDNDYKNKDEYKEIMDTSGFILLDNNTIPIFYKENTPITITGLTTTKDLENAYITDVESNFNITLIHEPELTSNIKKADIILSGHTIAAYIDIPYINKQLTKEGTGEYIKGKYNLGKATLYVSAGLGAEDYSFRILNEPEINYYELKNKE